MTDTDNELIVGKFEPIGYSYVDLAYFAFIQQCMTLHVFTVLRKRPVILFPYLQ